MTTEAVRARSLEVLSASADIPQRRFVTFQPTAGVQLPGTTSGHKAEIDGVTLEAYDDSEADLGNASTMLPVAMLEGSGAVEVEAGEELTVGMRVISGDDGRAMEATSTAGSNLTAGAAKVLGFVTGAAGAAGEIATICPSAGQVLTLS